MFQIYKIIYLLTCPLDQPIIMGSTALEMGPTIQIQIQIQIQKRFIQENTHSCFNSKQMLRDVARVHVVSSRWVYQDFERASDTEHSDFGLCVICACAHAQMYVHVYMSVCLCVCMHICMLVCS